MIDSHGRCPHTNCTQIGLVDSRLPDDHVGSETEEREHSKSRAQGEPARIGTNVAAMNATGDGAETRACLQPSRSAVPAMTPRSINQRAQRENNRAGLTNTAS